MSVLQQMTESLFAETIKRIAEDVWKFKFGEIADKLGNDWRYSDKIKPLVADAFIEIIKNDEELKAKMREAIKQAATDYFATKLTGVKA